MGSGPMGFVLNIKANPKNENGTELARQYSVG